MLEYESDQPETEGPTRTLDDGLLAKEEDFYTGGVCDVQHLQYTKVRKVRREGFVLENYGSQVVFFDVALPQSCRDFAPGISTWGRLWAALFASSLRGVSSLSVLCTLFYVSYGHGGGETGTARALLVLFSLTFGLSSEFPMSSSDLISAKNINLNAFSSSIRSTVFIS